MDDWNNPTINELWNQADRAYAEFARLRKAGQHAAAQASLVEHNQCFDKIRELATA